MVAASFVKLRQFLLSTRVEHQSLRWSVCHLAARLADSREFISGPLALVPQVVQTMIECTKSKVQVVLPISFTA